MNLTPLKLIVLVARNGLLLSKPAAGDLCRRAATKLLGFSAALVLSVWAFGGGVSAQTAQVQPNMEQTTGTPGSPSATTTIDGRYLPAPPQPFNGDIQLNATQSKPYWPATVVPPRSPMPTV
jgi:hypothetical protein